MQERLSKSHWDKVVKYSFVKRLKNPSGRFNIREYPPQSNFPEESVRVSKIWNTVFCDQATLAPISDRIINELLCDKFKRK